MSTIAVNFKRNWFDPTSNRRRTSDNPHTIPAEWKKLLPSDAEIVAAKAPVKVEKAPTNPSAVLKEHVAKATNASDAAVDVQAIAESAIAAAGKRGAIAAAGKRGAKK